MAKLVEHVASEPLLYKNDTQPSMSEKAAIEAHALPNLHVVGGLGGGIMNTSLSSVI